MQKKPHELPMHMYHRIYRFAQRNVEPDRIALTLDLPLRTVQRVLDRFAQAQERGEEIHQGGNGGDQGQPETFLDVYVVPKVRYVVADMSGWITAEHRERLREQLNEVSKSSFKVVALLMRDALAMDEEGAEELVSFHDGMRRRGRYAAILDPSRHIESFIGTYGLEEKIPVFGTEKTFEDEAFSTRRAAGGR
ncbi:MAG: hypothetical protein GF418_01170 [Chitinivibrionales bacterium]|nr:hypothetical protein [Chitinivibrionales bacterium]MBD3394212.1 hypothetical protein [Chitinivibrionales bacterium]